MLSIKHLQKGIVFSSELDSKYKSTVTRVKNKSLRMNSIKFLWAKNLQNLSSVVNWWKVNTSRLVRTSHSVWTRSNCMSQNSQRLVCRGKLESKYKSTVMKNKSLRMNSIEFYELKFAKNLSSVVNWKVNTSRLFKTSHSVWTSVKFY